MEEVIKNRKRAARRKRNLIARDLRMNKIYHEKVVVEEQKKRPRQKLRPNRIEELLQDD